MSKNAKNSLCRICAATCDDMFKHGKQTVHKYCYMYRKTEYDPTPNNPRQLSQSTIDWLEKLKKESEK